MTALFLLCFLLNFTLSNSLISTPTVSNSSGDYFITTTDYEWQDETIQCSNSSTNCYIYCGGAFSCSRATIDKTAATNIDITCIFLAACEHLKFSDTSSDKTNKTAVIFCGGSDSCQYASFQYTQFGYSKLFNLTCSSSGTFACEAVNTSPFGVDEVNIECVDDRDCYNAVFPLLNVNTANIVCGYSCSRADFITHNAQYVTFKLNQFSSNAAGSIDAFGANYIEVLCIGSQSCSGLYITCPVYADCNIQCLSENSCIDMNIKIPDEINHIYDINHFNLDCSVNNSCSTGMQLGCGSSQIYVYNFYNPITYNYTLNKFQCIHQSNGFYPCCPWKDDTITCQQDNCVIDCDADISISTCMNVMIDATNSTNLDLRCNRNDTQNCKGSWIYCPSGECNINCNFEQGCQFTVIYANNSNVLNQNCSNNGDFVCYQTRTFGAKNNINLNCFGDHSCQRSLYFLNETGSDTNNILCDGTYSCAYSLFYAQESETINIECNNDNSCREIDVECPEYDYIPNTNIINSCYISCNFSFYSCWNMYFRLSQIQIYDSVNLICPNDNSLNSCSNSYFICKNNYGNINGATSSELVFNSPNYECDDPACCPYPWPLSNEIYCNTTNCIIDCNAQSCDYAVIHGENSAHLTVLCNSSGICDTVSIICPKSDNWYDSSCTIQCLANTACSDMDIFAENNNIINLVCNGLLSCQYILFMAKVAREININCNNGGCDNIYIYGDYSDIIDIKCMSQSCSNMSIFGEYVQQTFNLNCSSNISTLNDYACNDVDIKIPNTNIFNLYCYNEGCSSLNIFAINGIQDILTIFMSGCDVECISPEQCINQWMIYCGADYSVSNKFDGNTCSESGDICNCMDAINITSNYYISCPTTAPTTNTPITYSPTTNMTTYSPTTSQPTTGQPTTDHPTTSTPTTYSPNSISPTTTEPTSSPTTTEPTASPTIEPTEIFSTIQSTNIIIYSSEELDTTQDIISIDSDKAATLLQKNKLYIVYMLVILLYIFTLN